MKRFSIIALLWTAAFLGNFCVLSTAQAQQQQREAQADRGRQFFQTLKDKLQLSPEQEKQIRVIMKESAEKGRVIREQYSEDQQKMREAMEEHMKGVHSAIAAVLDEQQQVEFEKMIAERRPREGTKNPRKQATPRDHPKL